MQNYFPCFIKLPQSKNSKEKLPLLCMKWCQKKNYGICIHMINKDLSHFPPYSILTGDSWIIGLKCAKGIRENVSLYIS